MTGNPIINESDLEDSFSSSSKMRMGSESHFFPSISGDFESEVIFFSDDSKMEGSSREYFSNKFFLGTRQMFCFWRG